MEGIPDIAPFRTRKAELDSLMAEPDFFADQRKAAELSREHTRLGEVIGLYETVEKLEADLSENQTLLADADADPDLKELAQEESEGLEAEHTQQRDALLLLMLPPDPSDSRNTIVEIRAGAGGDEASLFAGDLYRMYQRFAENRGWKIEPMGASESDAGGFKEVSFLITGEDVFKVLKYESGVHRVQRVPVTEASGRIHTSTATVAVLPEAEEVDVELKQDELRIEACRAGGPGGQHVNTTDSAVQVLHIPTGIMVRCQDGRSQGKNKEKALSILRAKLYEKRKQEEAAKYSEQRRSLIGSGGREEKIRTYNFPQSRVTDHRIGLTSHNLTGILDGQLHEFMETLQAREIEERMAELNS